jgi:hypothetical protein
MSLFLSSSGSLSRLVKGLLFLLLFTGAATASLTAENIYLQARSSWTTAQFWERNSYTDVSTDEIISRNVFSNYFMGSIGFGMEMVIWDVGKKRGSRVYFKTGLDLIFAGPSYYGIYNDQTNSPMEAINLNGGLFSMGFGIDLYLGGTFPKTDLIWGFGSGFNFMFPVSGSNYNVSSFVERFHFYATPSVLIGYDFLYPTPILRLLQC